MRLPSWHAPAPRLGLFALLLGLYLSAHGYHSRDGDQAYRLPLLLSRQDPTLYAGDPFVSAFSQFNPHRGYLAVVDHASRALGLSGALFGLFVLSFGLMAFGINRMARAVWPRQGTTVGVVAVGLILLAQAGNLGTNHLFEAMLLDRLLALGLGWVAFALAIGEGKARWLAPPLLGLAGVVHPSLGLQLALLLGASGLAWAFVWRGSGWTIRQASLMAAFLGICLAPSILAMVAQGDRLFRGLSPEEFRLLSVSIQSPQHMVPHLWRLPQWLAGLCYPILAVMTLACSWRDWPVERKRLAVVLGVNFVGLALALVCIEGFSDLRVTVFQPFRLATVFRGLALVVLAGRLLKLWRCGDLLDRLRAVLVAVGLMSDWALVVATAVELASTIAVARFPRLAWPLAGVVLVIGLGFLAKHDTESGHIALIGAVAMVIVFRAIRHRIGPNFVWPGLSAACPGTSDVTLPGHAALSPGHAALSPGHAGDIRSEPGRIGKERLLWNMRRAAISLTLAWAVPIAAMIVQSAIRPGESPRGSVARWLVAHCRFREIPIDDQERLAAWCRENTPKTARLIGPPGPKGFRYWSRREVAFNRAGSPYHAEGLADWGRRFREHVGFRGTTADFARAYLTNRQALEAGYQGMSDAERADLARRQGATHVLAAPPSGGTKDGGPLELLKVEGRYAVYRLREPRPAQALVTSAGTG